MRTFSDFEFDGEVALRHVIASSEYKDVRQAVASLTLFSNPTTVAQTGNGNLFSIIRCKSILERGNYFDCSDGSKVMHDDNSAAIEAFNWSNSIRRCENGQYNHVWSDSKNVKLYTSLANICVSPVFLAKLTDTNEVVRQMLRYRSFELYGFWPHPSDPVKPDGYDDIQWASPLLPIEDLEGTLRTGMKRKKKNRTVLCAKNVGWIFSSYQPDEQI